MIKTTPYRPASGLAALKPREERLGLASCYPDELDDKHRWQDFNLLFSAERKKTPMLMRKHLIEQRRAVSLKHVIDPKERKQDLARPVGPAARAVAAVQCGCWHYERR